MDSIARNGAMLRVLAMMAFLFASSSAGNFYREVAATYGGQRVQIKNGGQALSLGLDYVSGSGFESYSAYLYARFDMQIKLVPGNSAGTVATFYLSSQGDTHDEIDFEFLGNSSGLPYTIHTNVFVRGVGHREQQFRPWFDPTTAFHTYTILWNPLNIIFMVDNIPIRVFNNYAKYSVPYPSWQPMKMYASLWNADDWATQGGRVKTDWSKAPFFINYQNYNVAGCAFTSSGNSCNGSMNSQPWQTQVLDANGRNRIRWVQSKYMIYNYCDDIKGFPQGRPRECRLPKF